MSDQPPGLPRQLQGPAFPDDDGRAAPDVVAALAAYSSDRGAYVDALAALSTSRLLVPVVAVLGEVEFDDAGLAHDKTSDMAAVLMTGRDGRRALLAFTSLETMAAWDPQARPVPVPASGAARSAVQEEAAALVVDLAGPVVVAIEGQDLEALAAGWTLARVGERSGWVRPDADPPAD
ncbi:SseB family protein [Nocardioides kribbensis]|uniref:SseB family protein n=1 Tax=Nocardioides kribbensis TaxID=305517 RepID=UPI0029D414C7|nr:SseB family protein [Nocardioides kribbensis]